MPIPAGVDPIVGLPAGLCAPWDVIWPQNADGTVDLPTGAEAVTGTAVTVATEVLYALTARRFGLCTITLRPCRRECYSASWWAQTSVLPFNQTLTPAASSYWLGMACGGCGTDCSCTNISEVALPGPVYDVTQVKINGVVLAANVDYRLDNNRLLVRLGNEWPSCNDLNLEDTELNTWSVTIQQGEPVPTLGQIAVGELASQFVHMLLDTGKCMLPKPVQSIARQGVNITFLDPNEAFAAGRIGLYMSDLFIQTYNPNGRRNRAKVYNIDNLSTARRLGS